jgi:hypothetical protein
MYNISLSGIVTMNPPCTKNISSFKKKRRKQVVIETKAGQNPRQDIS